MWLLSVPERLNPSLPGILRPILAFLEAMRVGVRDRARREWEMIRLWQQEVIGQSEILNYPFVNNLFTPAELNDMRQQRDVNQERLQGIPQGIAPWMLGGNRRHMLPLGLHGPGY